MSAKFFKMVGLTPIPTRPPQVKVANGQVLISDHWFPKMSWWCNGVTMQADMKVLELDTFDAIQGYDWLQLHSPMLCHWANKTIEFVEDGVVVKLQGIRPPPKALYPMAAKQLHKRLRGNDIWAMVVLSKVDHTEHESDESVTPIQDLLT